MDTKPIVLQPRAMVRLEEEVFLPSQPWVVHLFDPYSSRRPSQRLFVKQCRAMTMAKHEFANIEDLTIVSGKQGPLRVSREHLKGREQKSWGNLQKWVYGHRHWAGRRTGLEGLAHEIREQDPCSHARVGSSAASVHVSPWVVEAMITHGWTIIFRRVLLS
jgi:hypothetical protein